MPRFEKGSPEAIEWGKRMREKKGNAKISRPSVEKGKPQPAKISGGSGAGAGKRKKSPNSPNKSNKKLSTLPTLNLDEDEDEDEESIYKHNPNISQDANDDAEVEFYEKQMKKRMKKGGRIPPPPSRVYGGKIPPPPSRSYDTAFEDKVDGIILKGGALNDCPTCCGMGIVKIKGKGAKSSRVRPSPPPPPPPYIYPATKEGSRMLRRDMELINNYIEKINLEQYNKITPEETEASIRRGIHSSQILNKFSN